VTIRSFAKSLLALTVVAASSYLLEVTLHRGGVPSRVLMVASSLLVGTIAGILVHVLSAREKQRQAYIECRLRVIAEMNHHIRNALQVITFYSGKGEKQEVGIVEAVERIQWALREVLPQLPKALPTNSAEETRAQTPVLKFESLTPKRSAKT
jgi:hypothetical protein